MSSTNPEVGVHNIFHCREIITGPRAGQQVGEVWTCGFRDAIGQTDKADIHSDRNTLKSPEGEVKITSKC